MDKKENPAHLVISEKFLVFMESLMNSSMLLTMTTSPLDREKFQEIKEESRVKILLLLDILQEMIIPKKEKKILLKQAGTLEGLYRGVLERTSSINPVDDDVYTKMNALIEKLQKSE